VLRFGDGSAVGVAVDPATVAASVHGGVECADCHRDVGQYPHAPRAARDRRAYAVARYELCRPCHFASYNRVLESVHLRQLSSGNPRAPLCTDCHGAHDVRRPGRPRTSISAGCARCHPAVAAAYARSAHGAGLRADNPDVPVCTDCHHAHDVVDPRRAGFRLDEPRLCGGCHADEGRMRKYGLSTAVLRSYLQDFHGVSAGFRAREQRRDDRGWSAVCTDCHGVHDIRRATDPGSSVMRANLAPTCRRCHADATERFPAAWLSHYEPSPRRAPAVFYVQRAFRVLIVLVLVGLLLNVMLHAWRVARNR
jgi:predicted CXXCH cytochrome family protein